VDARLPGARDGCGAGPPGAMVAGGDGRDPSSVSAPGGARSDGGSAGSGRKRPVGQERHSQGIPACTGSAMRHGDSPGLITAYAGAPEIRMKNAQWLQVPGTRDCFRLLTFRHAPIPVV
jgi:hypothetical protein